MSTTLRLIHVGQAPPSPAAPQLQARRSPHPAPVLTREPGGAPDNTHRRAFENLSRPQLLRALEVALAWLPDADRAECVADVMDEISGRGPLCGAEH